MFLSFSVTGAFLRPFVQLLQTAAKQGDALFFEPRNDALLLRAVNSSRSTHFLITIAASHLEAYRCKRNSETHTNDREKNHTSPIRRDTPTDVDNDKNDKSNNSGLADVQSMSGEGDKIEFHLLLSTKALMATVLRQAQGLSAMHLHYDGSTHSDDVGLTCDTLRWECVMGCGIVKKFALPLAEGQPERAYVPPDRFIFDACAAAREWGALLGCFPQSTPRVVLQPLTSGLKLWVLADADVNSARGAQPSLDAHKDGAAETVVVASHEHFLFVQMHSREEVQEGGGNNMPLRGTTLLPGKIIEMKPFKQVCMLADQLGMMIRVRSGMEGLPLFLEAVTTEEAHKAASTAAVHTSAFTTGNNNVTPQILVHKQPALTEHAFRVTFSMYIAAFDVPPSALENSEPHRTSGGRSINSTAITSAEDCVVVGVSGGNVCGDLSVTTCEAVMPAEDVLPTATKRSESSSVTARDLVTALTMHSTNNSTTMNYPTTTNISGSITNTAAELGYTAGSASSPPRVLVAATPTQIHSEYTGEPSMVSASITTPTHGDCRLSSSLGAMVVKGTPEGVGVITQGSHSKRSREGGEDDSASPLHHISPYAHTTIPTAMDPTAIGNVGKSPSFVAPTNASSWTPAQDQQQQQWPQLPSLKGVSASPISAQHPLDFTAFMREIAEEAKEEMYDEEEDEDLQRFLESCASLLVLPATPSTHSQ